MGKHAIELSVITRYNPLLPPPSQDPVFPVLSSPFTAPLAAPSPSVDSEQLTKFLNRLDATLTKNAGVAHSRSSLHEPPAPCTNESPQPLSHHACTHSVRAQRGRGVP